MLAFKSDVSHWRQKKEMVGVSVRLVVTLFDFRTFTEDLSPGLCVPLVFNNIRFYILFEQIVTNVFVQIVILLYLIDNNENTSWMILFGSGTGVLIEAWKVSHFSQLSALY